MTVRDPGPEVVRLGTSRAASGWWHRNSRGGAPLGFRGAALQGVLVMLSIPYGIASFASLRLRGAHPHSVGVPVISVGNLVVGGTGKTPLTILIARELRAMGRRVAIVSRGYGRGSSGTVLVSRGERPLVHWTRSGDEPYLMALLLKDVGVVVAERRIDGVREAVDRLDADAVVLDDAFQHVQMGRDLDIVAVDARSPVGNGFLLPAGPLREHPLGVGRADVIVATRADEQGATRVAATLGALAPGAPIIETRMKPVELWDARTGGRVEVREIRGKSVVALAGIADPDDFFRTVERTGVRVARRVAAPDHHEYDEEDTDELIRSVRETGAGAIMTTEKDAVRLSEWSSPVPVVALGIDVEIVRGRRRLLDALANAITRREE
jgi:tetraacyldisaccharide 4'-kinase